MPLTPNTLHNSTLQGVHLEIAVPVGAQAEALARTLRGHFQYYGVPGNSRALGRFRHEALHRWKWALGRRSQRYFTWERFEAILRRHPLPPARLPSWRQRQLRLANM